MDDRLKQDLGKTRDGVDTVVYLAASTLPETRPPIRLIEMKAAEREMDSPRRFSQ
jgi:hypothetical protein